MLSNTTTSLVVIEEAARTTVRFPTGIVLSESNIADVDRQLAAVVAGRNKLQLSLDLGGVALLTSVALGKLIGLHGKMREAGGRLTLTNLTPEVRQVFKVTRLDTLLEIHSAPETLSA